MWIPGGGSIETWRWCAELDYVYCYLSYFGYKLGLRTMQGFWDEMDKLGKDRNPYRAGFLQFVGVAETHDEAMRLYKEPAEYFYGRCLHVSPSFVQPPGYTTEETIRARIQSQVAAAASRERTRTPQGGGFGGGATSWDEIVEAGYVIVGTPDEVAERIREVCVNLNVGNLMLLLQFGNMSHDLAKYNTRLYAEQVLPQVRDLFSEWDNRWWPQPVSPESRRLPREVAR